VSFPRHTLADADALVAAAGFASTSVDAAERCVDCRRWTRRKIVDGVFYCSAPMHVRRAIAVAEAGQRIMRERAEQDAKRTAQIEADERARIERNRQAPASVGGAVAVAEVTPERVADAILDRRPILDLFPGRARETGSLTREQAETVDAGVTVATERLAARYGVTPAEVIRLGRDVVEETLAPVEPGPEVDDPREQPRPVEWSEVVTPTLDRPAALPRALRYRKFCTSEPPPSLRSGAPACPGATRHAAPLPGGNYAGG
jgi:hypothetical protein